jgi:glycopeptide antibiotics resistance protein
MLGLLLFLAQTSFQLQMISGYHATLIFVLGSSLGFIIELAQENLIAGRTFEWGDVMANMAGSSLFFIVNFLAKKKSANTSKL